MVSEKESSVSKLHLTTKILIVYLVKNSPLFNFLPKKWWSCDFFFFSASEAPKNFWGTQKRSKFWILDLKVCLKKTRHWVRHVWKKCPVSSGHPLFWLAFNNYVDMIDFALFWTPRYLPVTTNLSCPRSYWLKSMTIVYSFLL